MLRRALLGALASLVLLSCTSGDDAEVNQAVSVGSDPGAVPATAAVPAHDALTAALERWYGSGDIGGAVAAIGLTDGSVHTAATGDAAPGVPAQSTDTMRIGSITKTFMAALALRLDADGELDLHAPVARYLPDIGLDETVTVASLLAHTSGITDPDPTDLIASMRADPAQRFTFDHLVELADLPNASVEAAPGFAYANANYQLLGGVIEAATSTEITDVLRTEILDPARLPDTYLAGGEEVPVPIVPGNVDLDGDGREDSLVDTPYLAVETNAWTAGALVSTPTDLIEFARALFDDSLIPDTALAQMTETSTEAHGHGLGIFDLGIEGRTVYGNSGGGPGFHANFAHDPLTGTTAVVFTNCPSCPAGGNDTWPLLVDLLVLAEQAGS